MILVLLALFVALLLAYALDHGSPPEPAKSPA
jgi:hypothetical protein